MPGTAPTDFLDQQLALAPGHPLHALRQARDKAAQATEGSQALFFDPALACGLDLAQRLAVAAHASALAGADDLAAHYTARWREAGGQGEPADALAPAVRAFTDALTLRPLDADRDALRALRAEGLDTPGVVALAQLLAYLSYQVRLLSGLRALGQPAAPAGTPTPAPYPVPAVAVPGARLDLAGFTNAVLTWHAWLDVVQPDQGTPEQLAVLKESHPQAMVSDYYLLLVHQPAILRQRSIAFNAIMYAPGGLPRAERELAATVVSVINGCTYCASVHAQRFEQLAKRNDAVAQAFLDPDRTGTNAREAAIAALAAALTRAPAQPPVQAVQALRAAGVDDAGILDAVHVVAIFAWANRLMLNLGEPAEERAA